MVQRKHNKASIRANTTHVPVHAFEELMGLNLIKAIGAYTPREWAFECTHYILTDARIWHTLE